MLVLSRFLIAGGPADDLLLSDQDGFIQPAPSVFSASLNGHTDEWMDAVSQLDQPQSPLEPTGLSTPVGFDHFSTVRMFLSAFSSLNLNRYKTNTKNKVPDHAHEHEVRFMTFSNFSPESQQIDRRLKVLLFSLDSLQC
jgi:hypothetical protein